MWVTWSSSRSNRRTTQPLNRVSNRLVFRARVASIRGCESFLKIKKNVPTQLILRSSIPVPDTNTNGPFPAAQFTVKDTNPVWVFCRQAGHCQQGMVFAINPGNQFQAFQNAARGVTTATTTAATTAPAGVTTVTGTVTVSDGQAITTTYGSFPGSAAPTSPVSTDHQVVVGGPGQLLYSPSNITAQVGDTVTFQFKQKNHTVTQSSFAAPCNSLTLTSTSGQIGFDSGL